MKKSYKVRVTFEIEVPISPGNYDPEADKEMLSEIFGLMEFQSSFPDKVETVRYERIYE